MVPNSKMKNQKHCPIFLLHPPSPPHPPNHLLNTSQMNLPSTSTSTDTDTDTASTSGTKKQKHHHHDHHQEDDDEDLHQNNNQEHDPSLLPGLPDDIAQFCISLVPPPLVFSVNKSWRRLIYLPSFPPYLSIYALLHSTLPLPTSPPPPPPEAKLLYTPQYSNTIDFSSFDHFSSTWKSIPQPPLDDILLNHRSFRNRRFPIQTINVAGKLAIVAASRLTPNDRFIPALTHPIIFNPLTKNWVYGPPFTEPRRYCIAGACDGIVYMASGAGASFLDKATQSAEKWDLKKDDGKSERNWKWENIESLKDLYFSRDAIDAIAWRGKLCMVNVKGRAPKEGIIYHIKDNYWEKMPLGMRFGWRGPAAAMDEESLYMVDEYTGILKIYDQRLDSWRNIYEDKPSLKDAECMAAAGGRVCVVCKGGNRILVVDVTLVPPRVRVVETPPDTEAFAIHIMPRMSGDL